MVLTGLFAMCTSINMLAQRRNTYVPHYMEMVQMVFTSQSNMTQKLCTRYMPFSSSCNTQLGLIDFGKNTFSGTLMAQEYSNMFPDRIRDQLCTLSMCIQI